MDCGITVSDLIVQLNERKDHDPNQIKELSFLLEIFLFKHTTNSAFEKHIT